MSFNIENSIKLLSPEYFKQDFEKNNCRFLVSVFKENQHNFVIPTQNLTTEDIAANEIILEEFRNQGLEFSYYVPEDVEMLIVDSGPKLDSTTRYVSKQIDQPFEIKSHEVIKMDEGNFQQFIDAASICFPDWNNYDFTHWCLKCPNVEMLAVIIDGQIAAFAGYFIKPDQDYVLLMNAGTLPNFRRQGLHEYLIKLRINEVLKQKGPSIIYADVDDGGPSHEGFIKLQFEDGPIFRSYN